MSSSTHWMPLVNSCYCYASSDGFWVTASLQITDLLQKILPLTALLSSCKLKALASFMANQFYGTINFISALFSTFPTITVFSNEYQLLIIYPSHLVIWGLILYRSHVLVFLANRGICEIIYIVKEQGFFPHINFFHFPAFTQ